MMLEELGFRGFVWVTGKTEMDTKWPLALDAGSRVWPEFRLLEAGVS